MWKFSMTPMGFKRWTDTNETFPYQKRKRLIVIMLFLFCLCILCMCVYFLQCFFLLFFHLFIHSFIYLLLASLMRAPKLFSTIARKSQFENLLDVRLEDVQYRRLAFVLSRVFTLVR